MSEGELAVVDFLLKSAATAWASGGRPAAERLCRAAWQVVAGREIEDREDAR